MSYPSASSNYPLSSGRRRLLQALPALALPLLPTAALAQSELPVIPVTRLNNFSIRVSDPDRSQAFYQKLFGMPVQSRLGDQINLRVGEGPQFMSIRPLSAGEQPGITHLGYATSVSDLRALQAALLQHGYEQIEAPGLDQPGIANAGKTWLLQHDAVTELYFADPRGLIVQLTPPAYCGAAQCTPMEPAPAGLVKLKDINHLTVFLNDGAGANQDYQRLFGLEVQAYQGPNSPVNGIGDGYQFVMYAGPARAEPSPANIHHACFSMFDFELARVQELLSAQGLQAREEAGSEALIHYVSLRMPARGGAEGGTAELYFTDPDGILMQLQDTSYCGGGGKLGEICLNTA